MMTTYQLFTTEAILSKFYIFGVMIIKLENLTKFRRGAFGGGPGYYDILPPVMTGESNDHPPKKKKKKKKNWDLGYGCVCIKSIWRGAGYDDIHRPVLTGE